MCAAAACPVLLLSCHGGAPRLTSFGLVAAPVAAPPAPPIKPPATTPTGPPTTPTAAPAAAPVAAPPSARSGCRAPHPTSNPRETSAAKARGLRIRPVLHAAPTARAVAPPVTLAWQAGGVTCHDPAHLA